jgi:hypothetical protein
MDKQIGEKARGCKQARHAGFSSFGSVIGNI